MNVTEDLECAPLPGSSMLGSTYTGLAGAELCSGWLGGLDPGAEVCCWAINAAYTAFVSVGDNVEDECAGVIPTCSN